MKDKDLKMRLLEKLMDEMDDKEMSRFSPKGKGDDMAVIEEKQVVPADEVGDVLKEKMKQAMRDDSDASSEEMECMDDEDEDEDEDYGSRIMQRLNAAKKARAMK